MNKIDIGKLKLYYIKYGLYTRDCMPLALLNYWDVRIFINLRLNFSYQKFVFIRGFNNLPDTLKTPPSI